ncbi:MAG: nuclease domain-containing protein [Oscillochloridaceae bacterium umkhey_bin13]
MQPPPLLLNGRLLEQAPPLAEGQAVELSATPPDNTTLSLQIAGATLEPFLRPGDPAWYWRWQAPHAAGVLPVLLQIAWPAGHTTSQAAQLVVAPRKLDAQQHAQLLADLEQVGRALVQALHGAGHSVTLDLASVAQAQTPAESLALLFGADFVRLLAAVQRLARRPPDQIRPDQQHMPIGQVRDPSALVALHPEFDEATLATPNPGYASYEARLLRRLLERLTQRAASLAKTSLPTNQLAHLSHVQAQLRALLALPLLAEVPPLATYHGPSVRLQRDPDYRVVYQFWRRLFHGPLLAWEASTFSLPLAALPLLYERWCAARVALAVLELPGLTLQSQALMGTEAEGVRLGLPTDRPLLVLSGAEGLSLHLRYQARYQPVQAGSPSAPGSLDCHTRIPDLVLEWGQANAPMNLIILDAKYRLEANGGLPEAALADAYSYLGALGSRATGRMCRAAALLYPGHGPAACYASGVAALPLLPGHTDSLLTWMRDGLAL